MSESSTSESGRSKSGTSESGRSEAGTSESGRSESSRPSTSQRVEVSADDLPLHCPMPGKRLWDAHPKVYLPIESSGQERCPYCGTRYVLIAHQRGTESGTELGQVST